ncbi:folate receptor family protein [Anaeramoeba flamelloides]|uniref:Folate receptor family protein n=1 Tax=Anaeramoeba flamelloides TaxID=1746091 RepID=A0ABQ8XGX9_9EUKA|nr:folate receptor family protein [Anaeramoeba flamelloides]
MSDFFSNTSSDDKQLLLSSDSTSSLNEKNKTSSSSNNLNDFKKDNEKLIQFQPNNIKHTSLAMTLAFCVIFCLIILAIILGVEFKIYGQKPLVEGSNHGKGKIGIVCPNGTLFEGHSVENEYGCCPHYDFTCADDETCSELRNYNTILIDKKSKCDDLLGLLSCSPMSPYVHYFAPDISLHSDRQNINVCDKYCSELYKYCSDSKFDCSIFNDFPHRHCKKKVSNLYSNANSFCVDGLYLNVTDDHNHCFSSSKHFKNVNRYILISIVLVLIFNN